MRCGTTGSLSTPRPESNRCVGAAAYGGGSGIINESSGEERQALEVGSPLGRFYTFDPRPLTDFNSGIDLNIKQLTTAAAAMG